MPNSHYNTDLEVVKKVVRVHLHLSFYVALILLKCGSIFKLVPVVMHSNYFTHVLFV